MEFLLKGKDLNIVLDLNIAWIILQQKELVCPICVSCAGVQF